MPALRHLDLYDDITIPEPPTLFDKWEDNAPPARHQELEIDRHMDLNYDLFVDLTPEFNQPPSQKRQDRSAWHNMAHGGERRPSGASWAEDEAFHKAKLKGKIWFAEIQRYAKNYLLRQGVDETSAARRTRWELGLTITPW